MIIFAGERRAIEIDRIQGRAAVLVSVTDYGTGLSLCWPVTGPVVGDIRDAVRKVGTDRTADTWACILESRGAKWERVYKQGADVRALLRDVATERN